MALLRAGQARSFYLDTISRRGYSFPTGVNLTYSAVLLVLYIYR